jgi:hypothetical protein
MKKTEILVITDRSGSMASIAADVIGGFNQFMEDQKTEPGEVRVTHAQFDSEQYSTLAPHSYTPPPPTSGTPLSVRIPMPTVKPAVMPKLDPGYMVIYQGVPLSEVPPLTAMTFRPRGGTALYDAIGRTLNEQGARIKAEGWADLVVVCIITDGGENCSTEFNQEQIKNMVAHAEEAGWKFVFLAANQDAFESAQGIGSQGLYSQNFQASAAGTLEAYASTSATLKAFRKGEAITSTSYAADFSDEVKMKVKQTPK